MRSSSQEIDRQAAEWAARGEAGTLSPEAKAAFDTWLAADIRHLGAYGKAVAVLSRLDRLQTIGADALQDAMRQPSRAWTRRRLVCGGGIAGLAAAAGIAGVMVYASDWQNDFSTAIGSTRIVSLPDGSVVSMNTDSMLSVRFSRKQRRVDLIRGEALFNVAKDAARPFVVVAGEARIRAVGTSFTVRHLRRRATRIVVQDGVVEVARRSSLDPSPIRAKADTQTEVPQDAPMSIRTVPYSRIAKDLAWQYGQIAFDNTSLSDAAEEFARYSHIRIVVAPDVAGRTVTGLFASNDPVGFAKAVAEVLDLHTNVAGGEVFILR